MKNKVSYWLSIKHIDREKLSNKDSYLLDLSMLARLDACFLENVMQTVNMLQAKSSLSRLVEAIEQGPECSWARCNLESAAGYSRRC